MSPPDVEPAILPASPLPSGLSSLSKSRAPRPLRRRSLIALLTLGLASADQNADLQTAAKAGDLERVKTLLDQGAGVNSRSPIGARPLHEAAWSGNLALVDLLLARGADVNARHAEAGSTPLHYAVITNHPAVVRTLLDHG